MVATRVGAPSVVCHPMVVETFSSPTCHDASDEATGWILSSRSVFDIPSGTAAHVAACPSASCNWEAPEPGSGVRAKRSGSGEVSRVTDFNAVKVIWGDPWASVTRPTGPDASRASATTVTVS